MANQGASVQPVPQAGRSGGVVFASLCVMMFLQFFVWGAWYVSMTGFINAEGMKPVTSWAYTVGPIAAIAAPFFLGLVADRFFASERVLGVLHILGGLALVAAPFAASAFDPKSGGPAFLHPFILLLLAHMLCYMPTLGLTTSLAFHNLRDAERQFPLVRVLGTIGWIAGNQVVSQLPGGDQSASQFYLAGGAAALLGVFSIAALPKTPPPLRGHRPTVGQILGLDALRLLARPSFAVFIVCSFLICIPLAGYYQGARNYVEATGFESPTFIMSFGQMAEIVFMVVMPLFLRRLGFRWMLAIGMLAWAVRYGLFYTAADDHVKWMVLGGVLLHGLCYDFFFVTGMIYAEKAAPPSIRGQSQGFLVLVTQGLGMLIGAQVFGAITAAATTQEGGVDWGGVWLIPAIMAAAVLVVFLALFRERAQPRAGDAGAA